MQQCCCDLYFADSTAVTKENLHWKKEHKNNEYVDWEWTLIFNEFLKCTLSYM